MASRSWLVAAGLLIAGGVAAVVTGTVDPAALLSTEPSPLTHTVVRGDTLSKLARTHGCTVAELQQWNTLSTDRIDVGQVLVVGWSEGGAPVPDEADKPGRERSGNERRSRSARASSGAATSATPTAATDLKLPPEQACLAGPTVDGSGDDPEFAASAGLSYSQTKQAMDAFLPQIQRCIHSDFPEGTVELSITVACTGRVDRVRVVDGGGLSADLTACIADTLRYAAFPAHDLPGGETFTYPMRFSR